MIFNQFLFSAFKLLLLLSGPFSCRSLLSTYGSLISWMRNVVSKEIWHVCSLLFFLFVGGLVLLIPFFRTIPSDVLEFQFCRYVRQRLGGVGFGVCLSFISCYVFWIAPPVGIAYPSWTGLGFLPQNLGLFPSISILS